MQPAASESGFPAGFARWFGTQRMLRQPKCPSLPPGPFVASLCTVGLPQAMSITMTIRGEPTASGIRTLPDRWRRQADYSRLRFRTEGETQGKISSGTTVLFCDLDRFGV